MMNKDLNLFYETFLSEREKQILRDRFGTGVKRYFTSGASPKHLPKKISTYKEVAEKYKITAPRIRGIIKTCLYKMWKFNIFEVEDKNER